MKWGGKYTNAVRMWSSGHSEMDLVSKANDAFISDEVFNYYEVWKLLQKSSKFSGGAEREVVIEENKVYASENYFTKYGVRSINLSMPDEESNMSSPGTQSRLMESKTTKRKAKGDTLEFCTILRPLFGPFFMSKSLYTSIICIFCLFWYFDVFCEKRA